VQTEDQPPLVAAEEPLEAALCVVGEGKSPPPKPGIMLLADRLEIGRGAALLLDPGAWHIPETTVSRRHAVIERDERGWSLRDLGSRNGTLLASGVLRGATTHLSNGTVIVVGGHLAVFRLVSRPQMAAIAAERAAPLGPVATASPTMALAMTRLGALARTERPVLFAGETGTGKEVYARALHGLSGRPGPFVAVNCAGFHRDLLESELFGYRRGSHSQATEDHPGIIAGAEGGTLFLDEIGEMPHPTQAKLLRFLQDKTYQGLGALRARRADVRIVAATQSPYRTLRPDVLGRFGPEPLLLPALRRRREDIGLLARYFLDTASPRGLWLETPAFLSLCFYSWRRNVRQLESVLTEAGLLARDRGSSQVGWEDLPAGVRKALPTINAEKDSGPHTKAIAPDGQKALARRKRPSREELELLLRKHDGDIPELARAFGRHREQVWRWCKDYELHPERFRA
jgi:transcriptional regulator with PAS, ATPase and Fis domain